MKVQIMMKGQEKVIHFPAGVVPFGTYHPNYSPIKKYVMENMTDEGCDVPFSMMDSFEINAGRRIIKREVARTFGREANIKYISERTGKEFYEKSIVIITENETDQTLINRFFEI